MSFWYEKGEREVCITTSEPSRHGTTVRPVVAKYEAIQLTRRAFYSQPRVAYSGSGQTRAIGCDVYHDGDEYCDQNFIISIANREILHKIIAEKPNAVSGFLISFCAGQ